MRVDLIYRRQICRGLLVLTWLLLAGCEKSETTPSPVVDSNTNWLETCGDNGACGEGTICACGVCTETCDMLDCADFREGATCVQGGASDRLCDVVETPAAGLCLPSCDEDRRCPPHQLCLDGACQPDQRPPPRCDERFPCRYGGRCEAGICQPPEAPMACDDQVECEDSFICIDGRCLPEPECRRGEPDDCPDATECREGRCRPTRLCEDDSMCPPHARCDEGVCVNLGDCRSDDACPDETRCDGQRCVRL